MIDSHKPHADPMNEFYVGYLRMPPGLAFYTRLSIPLFLWLAIGVAAIVSRSQSDPGYGIWNTDEVVTIEGLMIARPYPMIRITGSKITKPFETVLIVETGKHGASRAASFDDRIVRAVGWNISRDGRRMLELAPGDDALQEIESVDSTQVTRLQAAAPRLLGRTALRGEIVDAKCFLGVMKPGHGRTHKECATLCIRGGIPPFFVTRDVTGARQYYLLTNTPGTDFDPGFLPFVADPVEISGEVEQHDDLLILRANPRDIHRL